MRLHRGNKNLRDREVGYSRQDFLYCQRLSSKAFFTLQAADQNWITTHPPTHPHLPIPRGVIFFLDAKSFSGPRRWRAFWSPSNSLKETGIYKSPDMMQCNSHALYSNSAGGAAASASTIAPTTAHNAPKDGGRLWAHTPTPPLIGLSHDSQFRRGGGGGWGGCSD